MASQPPYIPGHLRKADGIHIEIPSFGLHGLADWWREIDRALLAMILLLMVVGAVAVAVGSPASARRMSGAKKHYDDNAFFIAQLGWQSVGLVLMYGASRLSRDMARRLGIFLGFAMIVALILVLIPHVGTVKNGARRWLFGLQPSEFLKPSFAICLAWILSLRPRDPKMPVMRLATAILALVVFLLMMQPDFGSSMLFTGVWFVLLLLSGLNLRWIGIVGAGLAAGLAATYVFYENGRNRIDSFFGGGSAYDQVHLAMDTLRAGGWTGTGMWLGQKKMSLPEAHTDYIFSVIGEEFGLIACGLIALLYLAIVFRVLYRLAGEEDLFTVLAATGLVAQFGGQAFINILVNVHLFP
ncbi:MAG: hypothetical protein RLY97_1304, partial [Pseudomonadota bacterium]